MIRVYNDVFTPTQAAKALIDDLDISSLSVDCVWSDDTFVGEELTSHVTTLELEQINTALKKIVAGFCDF